MLSRIELPTEWKVESGKMPIHRSKYHWFQPSYGGLTHYLSLFGWEIQVRILSPRFKAQVKRLCRMIDDRAPIRDTKAFLSELWTEYGTDPDLVYYDSMAEIESDSDYEG